MISQLTDVELHSALAKKVRREELTEEAAQRVQELFRHHCDQNLYRVVPIDGAFVQARRWMIQRSTALRTLDALHLAAAHRHDVLVITADHVMSQAGAQFGVDVELLEAE